MFKKLITHLLMACLLTSCNQAAPDNKNKIQELSQKNEHLLKEINSLNEKIAKYEAENLELKNTPQQLLNKVVESVKIGDIKQSEFALNKLQNKYPNSLEFSNGAKIVEELVTLKKKEELEAKKIAALGFKALKINNTFTHDETTVKLSVANLGKRWIFDSYGDEWHYRESEKGEQFITARVNVASKSKDPSLFGIGVYVADGEVLTKVGEFEYKFVRWDDYATYLGNYSDYKNDFAHSSNIPFSLGASITNEKLKRPIYIVITNEGCHTRNYERFASPPVSYSYSACNSLKDNLSLSDFTNGTLSILKTLN